MTRRELNTAGSNRELVFHACVSTKHKGLLRDMHDMLQLLPAQHQVVGIDALPPLLACSPAVFITACSFSSKKNFFKFRLSPIVSGAVYVSYMVFLITVIDREVSRPRCLCCTHVAALFSNTGHRHRRCWAMTQHTRQLATVL